MLNKISAGGAVFLVFLFTGCSQPQSDVPVSNSPTKPAPYIASISQLDDPDYAMLANLQTSKLTQQVTGIQARFTNTDKSRFINNKLYYFNNEVNGVSQFEYNVDQLTRVVSYSSPGVDAIWQTADDVVGSYHDHAPANPDVITVLYRGSGTDQTWFTNDDDILYYYAPVRDAAGNIIGTGTFSLAGDDNTWFTADDFLAWLIVDEIVGTERRWVFYFDAGADNDWLTLNDNWAYRFALSTLDELGNRQRHMYSEDPGPDGLPFTADDVPIYYHDYFYDTQGRVNRHDMYNGAGADGIWFNADDHLRTCKILSRDANDLPVRTTHFQPGPDQTCLTTDDIVWGYHQDEFDASNLLTQSLSYFQPGVDNTWFTPDDVLIQATIYR